jgi:hypothetical protein
MSNPTIIVACVLCFAISAVISFVDVHRFVTEQGNGTAPISYLRAWETSVFFLCIGGVSVALFTYSLGEPKGWVDTTLALGTENILARALLIGVGTNVLIRTKLIELGGNKIGFEYIYDIFRNWSVNAYKATASVMKMSIAQELSDKTIGITSFEDDLIAMIADTINFRDEKIKERFQTELNNIQALKSGYTNVRYNEILIRMAIDYTNIRAVRKWIKGNSQLREAGRSDTER